MSRAGCGAWCVAQVAGIPIEKVPRCAQRAGTTLGTLRLALHELGIKTGQEIEPAVEGKRPPDKGTWVAMIRGGGLPGHAVVVREGWVCDMNISDTGASMDGFPFYASRELLNGRRFHSWFKVDMRKGPCQ